MLLELLSIIFALDVHNHVSAVPVLYTDSYAVMQVIKKL